MLVRHRLVRQLMVDRGHDPRLWVGPLGRVDPGLRPQAGEAAVGGGDQAGPDRKPARRSLRHLGAHAAHLAHDLADVGRRDQAQAVEFRRAPVESLADRPVFDDPAERLVADVAVIVVQEEWRGRLAGPAVGDADVLDRLRRRLQVAPQPDGLKHAFCAERDRRAAAVEGRILGRRRIFAIGHDDPDSGIGKRDGQRQADEPAAGDENLADPGRARIGPGIGG